MTKPKHNHQRVRTPPAPLDRVFIEEYVGDPWDRQTYEPSMWYDRFDRFYRPQGPERTLTRAFNDYRRENDSNWKNRPGPGPTWHHNYQKWDWVRRAEAWDDHVREQLRQAEEEERARARKERKEIIASLKEEVTTYLEGKKGTLVEDHKPSLYELQALLALVLREERSELDDLPTSRLDVTSGGEPIKVIGGLDLDDV